MYLYCVKSGKAVGEEKTWDDLPVHSNFTQMRQYAFRLFHDVKDYLVGMDEHYVSYELNKFTPAPWGEMRPAYLNLWGGVIEHALQHTMQIAVRKEYIRERF